MPSKGSDPFFNELLDRAAATRHTLSAVGSNLDLVFIDRSGTLARNVLIVLVLVGGTLATTGGLLLGSEFPLRERIDKIVAKSLPSADLQQANDATFLRRVYLDFVGTIPSAPETRRFLASDSSEKRAELIDRLLNDSRYPHHMATTFDTWLMERRRKVHIEDADWRAYLVQSFEANKPFHQLAQEILSADGADSDLRPAVKFYLSRNGETNLLTRDVSRMFLGMDLQCAQCHDHPNVGDYLQSDYYGVFAFLHRGYVFTEEKDKKKTVYFAEKAEGEVKYKSVFTEEEGATGPRLPACEPIDEPKLTKEELYKVKPEKNTRPIPTFSRRAKLAELATDGSNMAFNRNIANRIWAHMFGRGLVEPVDLHHSGNPPTHPELLELLAHEFAAMGFDTKAFLREIALSNTYQRAFDLPDISKWNPDSWQERLDELTEQLQARRADESRLEAELATAVQEYAERDRAVQQAVASRDAASKHLDDARKQFEQASQSFKERTADAQRYRDAIDALSKSIETLREVHETLPDEQAIAKSLDNLKAREAEVRGKLETIRVAVVRAAVESASQAELLDVAKTKNENQQKLLARSKSRLATIKAKRDQLREEKSALGHQLNQQLQQIESTRAACDLADARCAHQASINTLDATERAIQAARKARGNLRETVIPRHQRQIKQLGVRQLTLTNRLKQLHPKLELTRDRIVRLKSRIRNPNARRNEWLQDDRAELLSNPAKSRIAKLEAVHAQMVEDRNRLQREAGEIPRNAEELRRSLKAARDQLMEAEQQIAAFASDFRDQTEDRERAEELLRVAEERCANTWTTRLALSRLRALSPEQMAWSTMMATGVVERQIAAASKELDKGKEKTPSEGAQLMDPADRRAELENLVRDKLRGQLNQFVRLFGAGEAQPQGEFFATVDQALYFGNGGQLQGWLNPSAGNVTSRANDATSAQEAADELYLSILTRYPTPDEVNDIKIHLEQNKNDRVSAIREVAWAMLTSAEFRFNH